MSEGKTIVGRVLDAYRYYNRPDISILACHGIVDKALAAAHARGIAEGLERAARLIADDSEHLLVEAVAAIRAESERQKEPHE